MSVGLIPYEDGNYKIPPDSATSKNVSPDPFMLSVNAAFNDWKWTKEALGENGLVRLLHMYVRPRPRKFSICSDLSNHSPLSKYAPNLNNTTPLERALSLAYKYTFCQFEEFSYHDLCLPFAVL
jgi:hypothetical protein